jgi:deoxyhypusine synthase
MSTATPAIPDVGPIGKFIEEHYRHFNAAALVDSAQAYRRHVIAGGKMLLAMGGAMSTAEIGRSLAEMIRQDRVHIISCTGANLEEDLMNLVAHSHYHRIPGYRELSAQEECDLLARGLNRVTDTCIPEAEAFRRLQGVLFEEWQDAEVNGERLFPHEFMYRMIRQGKLAPYYDADPANSWVVAAAQKRLPIIIGGWEDSIMGNIFASYVIKNQLKPSTIKSGIEAMVWLARWYRCNSDGAGIGFFQIGGGISGDFPICVVPMMTQDLEEPDVPLWSYFCQISEAATSYGSYSGATPNEKITWSKLGPQTPRFIVESDATIVAPLVFAHVLGW